MNSKLKVTIATCLLTAVFAMVAAGCTPKSLCKKMADCEGISDDDEKICAIQMKAQQKVAKVQGCASEYADALACYKNNGECTTDYGDPEFDDNGACSTEWTKYYNCTEPGYY